MTQYSTVDLAPQHMCSKRIKALFFCRFSDFLGSIYTVQQGGVIKIFLRISKIIPQLSIRCFNAEIQIIFWNSPVLYKDLFYQKLDLGGDSGMTTYHVNTGRLTIKEIYQLASLKYKFFYVSITYCSVFEHIPLRFHVLDL